MERGTAANSQLITELKQHKGTEATGKHESHTGEKDKKNSLFRKQISSSQLYFV